MRARLVLGVDVIEGPYDKISSWTRAHEHVLKSLELEGSREKIAEQILEAAERMLNIPQEVVTDLYYADRLGRGRCHVTQGETLPDFCGVEKAKTDYWLIHFDDADRDDEIFTDEQTALRAFERHRVGWNCQLFKKLSGD